MDPQATITLFDKLIAAKGDVDKAENAKMNFKTTRPCPLRPVQVETIQEYLDWFAKRDEYDREECAVENALRDAREQWRELEAEASRTLPPCVWFRHGAVGIGVSFTDWGGSHYNVQIAEWEAQMPSLDHKYSGD